MRPGGRASASVFRCCPSVEDGCGSLFSFAARVAVSFAGGNDRAFHQHVPSLGELSRFAQTGLIGKIEDDRAYLVQVIGGRATDRAALL
jgi:hypothetical protein